MTSEGPPRPLRVLLVEDSENDAMLVVRQLRRSGFHVEYRRVETAVALESALSDAVWDVVLADFSMPHLTSMEAFDLVRRLGVDVPFIIVSGAIPDATAVEAMGAGVDDYIFKGNLSRLSAAIDREMRERQQRRDLERQVREAQKMEAVGRLAGGIAHDFNNLLSVIVSYASLLGRHVPDGPMRREVDQIERAAMRAAELTRKLLAFSRRQRLELRVVQANRLIGEMTDMVRRVIGEDIRLLVLLEPALHTVKVDAAQVEQVLLNLIVNARDAMPGGGTLTIATSNVAVDAESARSLGLPEGAYAALSISDTGTGMTPEVVDRLFEPFFTTKGPGHGTGLGLATSYGIVAQSRGVIRVATELGRGSTFTVYLPAAAEPEEAPAPVGPAPVPLVGTETILLVEDDAAVAEVEERILQDAGYRVLVARSGEEALRLAAEMQEVIHILVTDLVLPGMNGRELARRLADLRPGTGVLLVSGYDSVAGEEVRPSEYLQKPFTPSALLQKVRDMLVSVAPRHGSP